MKSRSTYILLISIALLGVIIWVQESVRARKVVRAAREVRLFDMDSDSLEFIEFNISNQVVRCTQHNGIWMTGDGEGNMGRADLALIERMISGLNSMGKGTTITQKHLDMRGFDETQYGFDPPSVTITAEDNNGLHSWLVGRRTPLGGMVYAKRAASDEIYTVPDKLLVIIPVEPDWLRDRVLFPGGAASLRRIEIRGSAGFVQLVKEPAGGWRMQQPVSAQADVNEVNDFIEKLYLFRIEEFVADNVLDFSIYGLQGETRQISVGSADGASRMLIIGDDVSDRPGFVYARRADDTSVFTVSADILPLVNVPSDRFRNASVLSLTPESISSVSIKRGREEVLLKKDESEHWTVVSPVVWDADAKAIEDLLVFWSTAVITEFNVETNAAMPDWIFEIGSAQAGTTNRIEVLPVEGKDGLLVRFGDDTLYQINLAVVPDSVIDPLRYKDRAVWALDKNAVKKIAVMRAGQVQQAVERYESDDFMPSGTNGTVRVNDAVFNKLLSQLEVIQAAGYITYNPSDLEKFGLSSPSLELYVGLSNSNELGRVLLVGNETPDGFYSMVKGRDVVFYLNKEQVDVLSADFLGVVEVSAVDSAE